MTETGGEIEANTETVNAILLWRIYDVLSCMLRHINEEDAQMLHDMHQEGMFLMSPPAYRPKPD